MESNTTPKNTHIFTYTRFSPIEALKSYKMSDSMISEYLDRMNEREPMDYYMKNILETKIKLGNSNILEEKHILKGYFITC